MRDWRLLDRSAVPLLNNRAPAMLARIGVQGQSPAMEGLYWIHQSWLADPVGDQEGSPPLPPHPTPEGR